MLDANICIYIMNKRPPNVAEKFAEFEPDDIAISSIVVAELSFGASKSSSLRSRQVLEQFLEPIAIIPFDARAALRYGSVRADLERVGKKIDPYDAQIAAHALSINATLVTNNLAEFSRVDGLKLENWFE